MGYLLQQLINGLTLGSIYGLIAIGYTMVYGIIGLINFAHGEVYMLGAFASLMALLLLGLTGPLPVAGGILLALLFSIVVTAAYGWAIERLAYRPLRRSTRLAPLISAIGVSIFLQNYVQLLQGARLKALPPLIEGHTTLLTDATGFQVTLSYLQILVIGLTFGLMLVFRFIIASTPLGRAQRATAQDKTMASLLGIDVDRTIALTFMIGASLAAVAGLLAVVYYGVIDFTLGFSAGIKAFTAAVLGGIGSIAGAMLGGILLGLIEALWSAYLPAEYRDIASFALLITFLIFRPAGLLGKPEIEKV
jgi:branched-chain amino acid transport system permease protein